MSETSGPKEQASPPPQPAEAPTHAGDMVPDHGRSNESIRIRAHSPIIYWWPVWLLSGIFWLAHLVGIGNNENAQEIMGLAFVSTLVFVIFSTTVRLRGANSIIFLLVVIIAGILLVTAGVSGFIGDLIASLHIRMSPSFYLAMFISVFGLSLLMFGFFDRVKYWEVVPGQVKEHIMWGGREEVLGGSSSKCQYKSDDFLRHRVLGLLFMGDLEIINGDQRVAIHNVFFARRKNRRINELIVMRPVT